MSEIDRVTSLATLGALPPLLVGALVLVEETEELFLNVGNTMPEIAARLGWTQGNIWLPERARRYITERHPVFLDVLAAVRTVLSQPVSVHEDRKRRGGLYFVLSGDTLRALGLLASQSAAYVDVLVELRSVQGGAYLRVFHLGPSDRKRGGKQLWP